MRFKVTFVYPSGLELESEVLASGVGALLHDMGVMNPCSVHPLGDDPQRGLVLAGNPAVEITIASDNEENRV